MKRRDFVVKTSATAAALSLAPTWIACNNTSGKEKELLKKSIAFELPKLPYTHSALEPLIDTQTMEIHHGKHHAGYVRKLNAALDGHALKGLDLISVLNKVTTKDTAIRNNAGGHFNHSLYWTTLTPGGSNKPMGVLEEAIQASFGSVTSFENTFSNAAKTVFGSGWAWLIKKSDGTVAVTKTANQDNPLMQQIVSNVGTPLLGIDVWEHAYYLKHQNQRANYISNFMQLVNWDIVLKNYES